MGLLDRLAYAGTHVLHRLGDGVHIEHDFHQGDVFIVGVGGNLRFHSLFDDVIHRQVEVRPRQCPRPGRVSVRDGEGIETATLGIGRAE